MSLSFLPTYITPALTDLTEEFLLSQNIRLLMLDFDNTIVPYTTDVPTASMERWLQAMLSSRVQLCVVSNSKNSRVVRFCQARSIPCITHAGKPFPRGIRRCLERFAIPAEQAALVGDQIYTDTLGANAAGVRCVLVRAIHNHNVLLKLRHIAELPFICAAKNRRLSL